MTTTAFLADHPLRQRRYWLPLAIVIFVIQIPFLHAFLRGGRSVSQGVPFQDTYDRASLGDDYWANGGLNRIVDNHLYVPGSGHNPLWLRARLPADARIAFDAWSDAQNGDIEVEAWGDGRNHGTGYMFMFGINRDSESRIAKLDDRALPVEELRAQLAQRARPLPIRVGGLEGAWDSLVQPIDSWQASRALDQLQSGRYFSESTPNAVRRGDTHVVRGQRYHMVITKKGQSIRWEIDGQPFMEMNDPAPLSGGEGPFHAGHDRFGYSSWANDTNFDNLQIEGL